MYNILYQHLQTNKLQFGFRQANSTEHVIIELADKLYESFKENNFTIGVFIGLSKAFDTENRKIILEKLNNYGVKVII